MYVPCRLTNGTNFNIEIEADTTLRSFRDKASEVSKIPKKFLKIIAGHKVLDETYDSMLMNQRFITSLTTLFLISTKGNGMTEAAEAQEETIENKPIQLFVKTLDGHTHTINSNIHDTFATFRKLVAKKTKIPLNYLKIIVDMNLREEKDDHETLDEIGVTLASGVQAVGKYTDYESRVSTIGDYLKAPFQEMAVRMKSLFNK